MKFGPWRNRIDRVLTLLNLFFWRRLLRIPWVAKKANKWIMEQTKLEFSQTTNCQVQSITLDIFCKELVLWRSLYGNVGKEGRKEERTTNSNWMDSRATAMGASLQVLKGQIGDRLFCSKSIYLCGCQELTFIWWHIINQRKYDKLIFAKGKKVRKHPQAFMTPYRWQDEIE